jgi:hypothetical protein
MLHTLLILSCSSTTCLYVTDDSLARCGLFADGLGLIFLFSSPHVFKLIWMQNQILKYHLNKSHGLDGPGIEPWWGRDFSAHADRPWGPPSLLYNGYRVFPGGKERPGHDADPSLPSSAEALKSRAISLPPLGHNQACNGVYFTFHLYKFHAWKC